MTPEQKRVHERLSSSLPSRIHQQRMEYEFTPKNLKGNGGFKPKKPVIVDGVRYESMSEAEKKTGVSRQAIYQRILRKDAASYADRA